MGAPSSMWSSRPPEPTITDVLSEDELKVVRRMRAKKERELAKALRTRERKERLAALKKEIAKLEAEGL